MEGIPAIYCGRLVSKENFRVFIYDASLNKKLVESWVAFEAHMATGLWFASEEDALFAKTFPVSEEIMPPLKKGKAKNSAAEMLSEEKERK